MCAQLKKWRVIMQIYGYNVPFTYMPKMDSPQNILKKITTIAVPAIVMLGMQQAATAEAGPLAYAACVAECTAATLGSFLPACLAACTPFLAAPTP